jgi:flagellin
MIINHNLMAMNTHRQLGINQTNSSKSMERLSSGLRINRAGDDAAGLAISEKMRGQIRGLKQAMRNAQDGISMIQTAEGALEETHAILQRMRELATQSANDTNTDADRAEIQKEINQLTSEISRIAETTEFNTQKLLDGSLTGTNFHIGANQDQNITLDIRDMSAEALEVLSYTISMGSAGKGITGVEADLGFRIEDYELSATEGGAVAAELLATEVDNEGFIADTTMSYAVGVTEANGGVEFVDNKISVDTTYSEFAWDNIDTLETNTVEVTRDGTGLKVTISGQDGDGNVLAVTDYATLDEATGNYIYDSHGISFAVSEDVYEAMADDGSQTFELDFAAFGEADLGSVNGGEFGTASNYTQTGLTTPANAAVFSDITYDQDNLIEGAYSIKVNASGLGGVAGSEVGQFEVTIYNEDGDALVTDSITFSAGELADTFTYDNHGVSFSIDNLHAAIGDGVTAITFEGGEANGATAIGIVENSVDITNGSQDLELKVTDQNGDLQTLNITLAAGEQDIQNVVDKINEAASDAGFDSNIASVEDGNIKLVSLSTGSDATIEVGGSAASAVFGETEANGADSSVKFTLEHKTDSSKDIESADMNPSAKSVSFTDANGNDATFTLKGYDNLDGVDVGSTFAASDFNREVTGIDVSSYEAANEAITVINDAIETVSAERSMLGAIQNRLEHTIANLGTSAENLQAAESRIRDLDMAEEIMAFTKNNILQQAATAMLAQANMAPQSVLQLLG